MRLRGRCVMLLMLLLALGVAARETPELLELTEDMSNEGMVVDYKDPLPELTSRNLFPHELARPALAPSSAFTRVSNGHVWPGPSWGASCKAGRDILKFLSIKRE